QSSICNLQSALSRYQYPDHLFSHSALHRRLQNAVAVDLHLDRIVLRGEDLDLSSANDAREAVLQVPRLPGLHLLEEAIELPMAPVIEEEHVEVLAVRARIGRDDPVAGVVSRAADHGEGGGVLLPVDADSK